MNLDKTKLCAQKGAVGAIDEQHAAYTAYIIRIVRPQRKVANGIFARMSDTYGFIRNKQPMYI